MGGLCAGIEGEGVYERAIVQSIRSKDKGVTDRVMRVIMPENQRLLTVI